MIATLALVFAITGGAYAAKKYLITSTKQISPKVLKSLQGKAGTAGAPGAVGGAGSRRGAKARGTGPLNAGANGNNGGPGKNGESVTLNAISKSSATCEKLGGTEAKVGSSSQNVCNGKKGEPWPAGGTLPAGATETGAWNTRPILVAKENSGSMYMTISFPIPLAAGLSNEAECGQPTKPQCAVHYINSAGEEIVNSTTKHEHSAECKGNVAEPAAEPGNLCVYASGPIQASLPLEGESEGFFSFTFAQGTGKTGAIVSFSAHNLSKTTAEEAENFGTWAVTAP